MAKIKICGLRRREDAEILNNLMPEYAGFVFWPRSKRNVSLQEAKTIREYLVPDIDTVGVFVNPQQEFVIELVKQEIISKVQLHGSETNEYINELRQRLPRSVEIIKAFEVSNQLTVEVANSSAADIILVDSGKGSGNVFEWTMLKGLRREYFLAGGLSPENVAEAVRTYQPYAVDVSSGVETDGFKDIEKIRMFCREARKV